MSKPKREHRVPIMLTDDEVKAIDQWRFANRVATRSEAIRQLAAMGLTKPKVARRGKPASGAPNKLQGVNITILKFDPIVGIMMLETDEGDEPIAISRGAAGMLAVTLVQFLSAKDEGDLEAAND